MQFFGPNNIKWQCDLSLMNCTRCARKQVSPIQHFIFQLMHTTLKNVELLKIF